MPRLPFPAVTTPVASGPMKLAWIVLPPPVSSTIPGPLNALIASPRTVLWPAEITRPAAPPPAESPFSSMAGVPA